MIVIGLTGGIGSGKSTVAEMLVERGAVRIDADEVAHDVLGPGLPAYERVVARFGETVVSPDGSIDRARLATAVFNEPKALADLEAIVHPEVRSEITARIQSESGTNHVVVVEVPLLIEKAVPEDYQLDGVLVIDAPVDIALHRLVTDRGMDRGDAEARIASQASRSERIAKADFVIMNMGTLAELAEMVRRAWEWMQGLLPKADGS